MQSKKTLIIGATNNPDRYAYKAAKMLIEHGHDFIPVGIKKASLFDKDIITEKHNQDNVDTITLYIGPDKQRDWADYIIRLNPKRVIFNPGTENPDLQKQLEAHQIPYEEACTLVLLSTGVY